MLAPIPPPTTEDVVVDIDELDVESAVINNGVVTEAVIVVTVPVEELLVATGVVTEVIVIGTPVFFS